MGDRHAEFAVRHRHRLQRPGDRPELVPQALRADELERSPREHRRGACGQCLPGLPRLQRRLELQLPRRRHRRGRPRHDPDTELHGPFRNHRRRPRGSARHVMGLHRDGHGVRRRDGGQRRRQRARLGHPQAEAGHARRTGGTANLRHHLSGRWLGQHRQHRHSNERRAHQRRRRHHHRARVSLATLPGQPTGNALVGNDASLSALSSADPTCSNSNMFKAYFGSTIEAYRDAPSTKDAVVQQRVGLHAAGSTRPTTKAGARSTSTPTCT